MAVVCCNEPSAYRRQTLKIAKLLNKEDVDEIVYLSEDFVPPSEAAHISSGVNLMRCLERHGRLGPNHYHYLTTCLREVGRFDLATSLIQSMNCSLPFIPPSFTVPCQMQGLRLGILHSKRMQYAQHMGHMNALSRNQLFWENEWKAVFEMLCMSLGDCHNLPESGAMMKVLGITLSDINGSATSLVAAFRELRSINDIPVVRKILHEVDTHYDRLNITLDGIQWKKQTCQVYLNQANVASLACSFLGEFLSELFGGQVVMHEAEKLSEGLAAVESIVNIAQKGLSMLQWLFGVLELVVSSSLDINHHELQLKSMISELLQEGIAEHHRDLFTYILKDSEVLLKKIQEDGLINAKEGPSTSLPPSVVQNCPVLNTLYVNALLLQNASLITPGEWTKIKLNFRMQEKEFARMYSCAVGALFQLLSSVVDCFRQNIMSAALIQAPASIQELITELFKF